jgi:hypothetical protein
MTGGGFPENIPRVVPKDKDLGFSIDKAAWEIPPLFKWLQSVSTLPQQLVRGPPTPQTAHISVYLRTRLAVLADILSPITSWGISECI